MAEQRKTPHGLPFAPVKVGVLIDLDMGTKDDFLATLRFGFDEAHEHGIITRPVELVVKEAIGLPRLEAKNSIDGYLDLVRQGVLCTIGPLITKKVRLLPAVNGGPRTHMSLGPFDHKAYKGDWLVIRRIEGDRTVFVGLHEPACG
jgi:hypothetical protein